MASESHDKPPDPSQAIDQELEKLLDEVGQLSDELSQHAHPSTGQGPSQPHVTESPVPPGQTAREADAPHEEKTADRDRLSRLLAEEEPRSGDLQGDIDQILQETDPVDQTTSPLADQPPEGGEADTPPAGQVVETDPAAAPENPDPVVDDRATPADLAETIQQEETSEDQTALQAPAELPDETDQVETAPARTDGTEPQSGGDKTTPIDPDDELRIDPNDDEIAEEEIAEALDRIHQAKDKRDAGRRGPGTAGEAETIPAPLQTLLRFLTRLDHTCRWVPPSLKEFAGYLAISTLLLGIILWILIVVR